MTDHSPAPRATSVKRLAQVIIKIDHRSCSRHKGWVGECSSRVSPWLDDAKTVTDLEKRDSHKES